MLKYVALALAVMAAPVAASAATYDFSYTGTGGAPVGSGVITTSNTLDAVGGYDITDITGTFGGSAITGLIANPNQPNETSLPTNTYDNVLFPSASMSFDRYGVAFNVGTDIYNVFDGVADGGTTDTAHPYGLIINGAESFGNFSLTAVPEPATWAMMLVGFGGLGAVIRSRRNVVAA
jgi:hypothetical protein